MSQLQKLLDSYLQGKISRPCLITRLESNEDDPPPV